MQDSRVFTKEVKNRYETSNTEMVSVSLYLLSAAGGYRTSTDPPLFQEDQNTPLLLLSIPWIDLLCSNSTISNLPWIKFPPLVAKQTDVKLIREERKKWHKYPWHTKSSIFVSTNMAILVHLSKSIDEGQSWKGFTTKLELIRAELWT